MNSNLTKMWVECLRDDLLIPAACIVAMIGASGCGSSGMPSNAALTANEAVERGTTALEEKDWATADAELTTALDSKTLSGDQYEEAVLARIKARLENDNLEGAEADLALIEDFAAAMDQVLLLKADLQLKQGDAGAAKKTFAMAKKINRNLKPLEGM